MAQTVTDDASTKLLGLAKLVASESDFSQILDSLAQGNAGGVGGVWGSSRALVAAVLAAHVGQTLVVLLPHASEVDDFCDDLAMFVPDEVAAAIEAFPATEALPNDRVVFDEMDGIRQRVLKRLAEPVPPRVVVASIQSLLQCVPSREQMQSSTKTLRVGEQLDMEALTKWLVQAGFRNTAAVEIPGEFSIRGGILDLYLSDAPEPIRLELFGDEIESIRPFSVETQRSTDSIDSISVTALSRERKDKDHFASHLPTQSWTLLVEPQDLASEAKYFLERADRPQDVHTFHQVMQSLYKFPSVEAAGVPASSFDTTCHLAIESVERFSGDFHRVAMELDATSGTDTVFLVCETPAEAERLKEMFAHTETAKKKRLHYVVGRLQHGFRLVKHSYAILSGAELFLRQDLARPTRRKLGRSIDSFLELREGDLVVHLTHGIGRYRGLKLLDKDDIVEEHLEVEFHGGTKIYVPSSKIELVQKYIGGTKVRPKLASIGGKSWLRQKQSAMLAVTDLAADLIDVQAGRAARPGIAFPEDSEWQREFDAQFPYQETADQITAIRAIKGDMKVARPMDRLLCGDVGFGKTEVAMRAAFKAVDAGYQVGVLVPTTILAEQHGRTFKKRLAEFPFDIGVLSRFATQKEQRQVLERMADGSLDIVIGTHRLASQDVRFNNLGLLIIDEEQRFGVEIKERLKAVRQTVDILTMTATPIPRTLHLSLLGIRDISNLESPPADRIAVETRVVRFDEDMIRRAILRELNREGQVFFVHNRVHDMQAIASRLQRIVPEATIAIAHGQMPEHELEEVMMQFMDKRADILLATTIVESGLDIPNANTIFIDDANHYGLAEMHQLRGRVGRYKHRAYCYLLIGEDKHLSSEAARRLRAIEEYSQMGAGFAIAMRDLEIRGAGNILGTQQSGHIAAVGYELYCSLLENAVRRLKNMPPREVVDVHLDLPGEGYLPGNYVPDMRLKIDLYRRLSRMTTLESLSEFYQELQDRFGSPPESVGRMLQRAELRILAHASGIRSVHIEERFVVFGYTAKHKIEMLANASKGRLRIVDTQSAYLPLDQADFEPERLMLVLKSLLQKV